MISRHLSCAVSVAVFLFAGRLAAEDVRGIIAKIDPENKVLILEGKNRGFKGTVLHLKLREDTEIVIGRKPAKITDLVTGKRARVLFETQGVERVAIRITMAGSLSALFGTE